MTHLDDKEVAGVRARREKQRVQAGAVAREAVEEAPVVALVRGGQGGFQLVRVRARPRERG